MGVDVRQARGHPPRGQDRDLTAEHADNAIHHTTDVISDAKAIAVRLLAEVR